MQGFSIYTKNITLENYQDYKGMTFSISLDSENIIMFVFKGNYTVDELMSMLSAVPSEEIILATMGSGRYTPSCEITDKICILASQQNIDLDITLTPTDYARFLTFTLIDNGTALSVEARDNSITGVDGKIEIPSEYMGMPVTTIGEYAFFDSTFFDCSSLSEITIPQSVTTIREGAFYNCSNLQSLDLRACTKLTTIGNYAFTDCSSLTKITIPQSVKTIGDYAFSSCRSLSEITIPESVTTIGDHAFDGCYSLVEVYNKSSQSIETTSYGLTALNVYSDTQGESKLKYYNANGEETQDGDYIFYIDGNTKYFIKYKGQDTEITLPTISSIGSYEIYKNALGYNEKITSVILSDSVTTIGDLAFYD